MQKKKVIYYIYLMQIAESEQNEDQMDEEDKELADTLQKMSQELDSYEIVTTIL